MRLGSRPFFVIALVLLVGIGFLAPGEAQAGVFSWIFGGAADAFLAGVFGLIYIIGYLFGWLIAVLGSILEYVIKTGNVGQAEAVKAAWTAVRDLANLFFGLGMVVIALATIFHLEGYGWKRALPRLIIAAILINFSFVIAGSIIDVGNIFSFFFLNQFKGSPLSTAIASALGTEQLFDLKKTGDDVISKAGQSMAAIATLLLTNVLLAVTAVTFGTGIVFLFVRIFMLWLLIVISPLVWIFWVFPGTQQYWHKWWETFLKWVFFAPIYIFMIWLALYIITSKQTFTQIITSTLQASQQLNQLEQSPLLTKATVPQTLMQFGFMTMMMFGALYVAQMGGMYGAQTGMKLAQGVPKFGLRMADRWAARGLPFRPLPWISRGLRFTRLDRVPGLKQIAKFGEKTLGERFMRKVGERYGEKWEQRLQWLRRTIPTVSSPTAVKRAYAAIAARVDEDAYAGAGGRLQDLYHRIAPWDLRKTAYEEREIEQHESAMAKEIETSTTEEQLAGVINDLVEKATGGNIRARATLIAALEKDIPMNGLNTAIASLPDRFKKAIQEGAKDIARAEAARARDAGNLALEGEINNQLTLMNSDLVHQGYFLRSLLDHTLSDTDRAARVANDLAVAARSAGNHSLSGLTRFNRDTGEFGWNDYESMKNETVGQFQKGEPQLTMRRFHPDFFMRDQNGRLTDKLSSHGFAIFSQGMTFNHIREIHQMRPETSENFVNNFETIRDQFAADKDKKNITQMVTNILHHKGQLGVLPGKYHLDEKVVDRVEDPPGSNRFINIEEWWIQKEDAPPGSGTYSNLELVYKTPTP